MLRFAFKPRHPITQVAFTADACEVVTAQPHTGVAVRSRLTGAARVTIPILGEPVVHELVVYQTTGWMGGWVGLRVSRSLARLFDLSPKSPALPIGPLPRGRIGIGIGFVTRSESLALVSWSNFTTPTFQTWKHSEVVDLSRALMSDCTGRVRTTGRIQAISPDANWFLCLREQTRPILASVQTGELVAEVASSVRLRHLRTGCVTHFSTVGAKLVLGDGESLSVFDLASVPRAVHESEKRKVVQPLFTLERPDPIRYGTFADKQAEHWRPPVAFDHAGQSLLTLGLRNRVQRIDLATGGVMNEWGWRCEPIRSLAVSPDGLTAAAGCQRGELLLWDLE